MVLTSVETDKETFPFIMDLQMSGHHSSYKSSSPISGTTGGSTIINSNNNSNSTSNGNSKPIHIHPTKHTTLFSTTGSLGKNNNNINNNSNINSNNSGSSQNTGKKIKRVKERKYNRNLDDDEYDDVILDEEVEEEEEEDYNYYNNDDSIEDNVDISKDDSVVLTTCLESNLIIKDSYNSQMTPEAMQQQIQKSKQQHLVEHKIESFNITPIKNINGGINSSFTTMNASFNSSSGILDDSQISISPSTPTMNQSLLDSLVSSGQTTLSSGITSNLGGGGSTINLDLILSQLTASTTSDIAELFSYFRNYKPTFGTMKKEPEFFKYQNIVNTLFEKDYVISTIPNKDGELCATYPPELIVIEKEKENICTLCNEKDNINNNNHNHTNNKNGSNNCINGNNNLTTSTTNGNGSCNNNTSQKDNLQKLISQSRFARVRTRFPFPVIYYHGKNICRSSTLSQKIEYMLQSSVNTMKKQFQSTVPSISPTITASIYGGTTNNGSNNDLSQSTLNKNVLEQQQQQQQIILQDEELSSSINNGGSSNHMYSSTNSISTMSTSTSNNNIARNIQSNQAAVDDDGIQNMEYLRNRDILVIKHLNIRYICDLMVENKKKKFGFFVCSSEKVDMHKRYQDFVIASTPYPGVEFFAEFTKNKHNAQDLIFQWDNTEDPALLNIQNDTSLPLINWEQYKTWDLIYLTQNYFKLLLKYIADDSSQSGLLVHCISGWDRTPLFISLIRLSLWADGEVHNSLESWEMLILTVAYDWFLFSHQLSDRSSRGEDIFYFCFYFLEHLASMDFSIHSFSKSKLSTSNSNGSSSNNNNNNNNNINNNNSKPKSSSFVKNNEINNNNNIKSCNHNNNNNNHSWGKSHSNSFDSSHTQSAPVTPQNNSPKILIGLNKIQHSISSNNNSSSYISAPSTPLGNSPMKDKNNSHLINTTHTTHSHNGSFKTSPTISSTIPVDVPNAAPKKRRGSEEEIGGSWQLMGSLNERKSSLNSLGSTPKNHFNPSSSYNSASEPSDHDDDNNSTSSNTAGHNLVSTKPSSFKPNPFVTSYVDDDDSDCMTFSFEQQDATKHFENFNMMRQQQSSNVSNNNNSSTTKQQSPSINEMKHSNAPNLTLEEIGERRKKRLLEIRNLFIHFYQNHCSASESYWSKFLTSYFPKFG